MMLTLTAVLLYHTTKGFGKEEPSPDAGSNPFSYRYFALGYFGRDR
jgi:hypothetical protein